MLNTPRCYQRKCKNFIGPVWMGGGEETENNICKAFPEGIPNEIAYGRNLHLKPHPDQDNDIVFEKE